MTEKGLAVFCGQEKVNRTGPRGKAGEWLNFCNFPAEGLERLPDRGAKHRIKRSLCFWGVLFVGLFCLVFHSEIYLWVSKFISASLNREEECSKLPNENSWCGSGAIKGGMVTGEEFIMPLRKLEKWAHQTERTPDKPESPPETWQQ